MRRHLALYSTTAVAAEVRVRPALPATVLVEFMSTWSNLCLRTVLNPRKIHESVLIYPLILWIGGWLKDNTLCCTTHVASSEIIFQLHSLKHYGRWTQTLYETTFLRVSK